MLPTITRTVEVVLRLVPDGLREASLALGATGAHDRGVVVLPTARTGMTTAVVLGIARAVGETAPLLFTAFGFDVMNANPFSGPQESLPLFVYRNIRKLAATSRRSVASTGALVLMLIVLDAVRARPVHRRSRTRRRRGAATRTSSRPLDSAAAGRAARRSPLMSRRDRPEPPRRSRTLAATLEAVERERLVRRPPGARARRPAHGGGPGHRADRPVGLRQVDVPADAQPHARAGARRRARRRVSSTARTSTAAAAGDRDAHAGSAWCSRSPTRSRP